MLEKSGTWSNMTLLIDQLVKNTPAMQEMWGWFLGHKDPLEKEMATHSSIIAWRIPRTEEPSRLWSLESQRAWHNLATKLLKWQQNTNTRLCIEISLDTFLFHIEFNYHQSQW